MFYSNCGNSLSTNDIARLQCEYWVWNIGVQQQWDWGTTVWNMCSYRYVALVALGIVVKVMASILRPYNLNLTYTLNETIE